MIPKQIYRTKPRSLSLLQTEVLSVEKQASAAWDILVNEGHQIIKERGRRISIDLVRLLQSRDIQLSKSLQPVLKDEYQKWLMAKTTTFSIPGPGLSKPLPIETAWMNLRVLPQQTDQAPQNLETQLASYREWEKLGDRMDAYDAIGVAKVEQRVVFIGGPGTGKSTLCRKLAHDLTILEEHVLLVHLPEVVHRIGKGMSIDEALVDQATDGKHWQKIVTRYGQKRAVSSTRRTRANNSGPRKSSLLSALCGTAI